MAKELKAADVVRVFARVTGQTRADIGIMRVNKGVSTECWRILTGSETFLIKVALRGQDYRLFSNMCEAIARARAAGVITPKVLHASPFEIIDCRSFLIQEWLPGTDAEDGLADATEAYQIEFFQKLGKVLGKLHSRTTEAYFGSIDQTENYSGIKDYLNHMLITATDRLEIQRVMKPSCLARIRQAVSDAINGLHADTAPCLVHLDLHLSNVLLLQDGEIGLLDFEHAKIGDPIEDLVKLHVWVFNRYAGMERELMKGYCSIGEWPDEGDARLHIHFGIYYLSALSYFVTFEPDYVSTWLLQLERQYETKWGIKP